MKKRVPCLLVGALFILAVSIVHAGEIIYAGADGSTQDKAILMQGATSDSEATAAEYVYLRKHYPGCKMNWQTLVDGAKRTFDQLDFTDTDGHKHPIFFDITATNGKF
jgi:hypothetical protein